MAIGFDLQINLTGEKKYTETDILIASQEAFDEGKEIGFNNGLTIGKIEGWNEAKTLILELFKKGI